MSRIPPVKQAIESSLFIVRELLKTDVTHCHKRDNPWQGVSD
jgi:hypothetical protein